VLTNAVLDPHSKMPEFKACGVSVARIGSADDVELLAKTPQHTTHSAHTNPSPDGTTPPSRPATTHRPTLNQLLRPSRRKDLPMLSKNLFLQGIYPFEGAGLDKPAPIAAELAHVVPDGVVNQTLYFRGGNSSSELVTVVLMRDGVPMRYFPIGAKGDVHVPLRVVEDIEGGSVIELQLVAELGVVGSVVVDLGMVEH
jgi:assimilatory nitrate reductase catalytic subunit